MCYMISILFIIIVLHVPNLQATSSDEDESPFYSFSSSPELERRPVSPKLTYTAPLSKSLPDQFWGINNADLEDLFAHSNDLVCIIDYGGKFIRLNKKWKEVLGYEDEELMASPYHTFIHSKDLQKTLDYEKKYTYAGLVNRYRGRNGQYRWLDWIGIPPKSRDRHLQYRFALARDITIAKLYEKEISKRVKAKSKEEGVKKTLILAAVAAVQAAQVGDLMSQEGGGENSRTLKVILQNFIQLTESTFGFIGEIFYNPQQQAFFRQYWGANTLANEAIREVCADNNLNATEGESFDLFFRRVMEEKEPIILSNLKEAFKNHDIPQAYQSIKTFLGIPLFNRGELTGVIGLANFQDLMGVLKLTNRAENYEESLIDWLKPLILVAGKATGDAKEDRLRRVAENERQERIRVEESNRIKTLFIAHMSHEIRTPLTGIIGSLELMQKNSLTKENLDHLQDAELSAQSLLYIANDILDVAKLEAGIFKLEEKEFIFRKVLQETLDLVRPDIEAKKLDLNMTIASNIPEQMKGDALRLRQVLHNLLTNALKFTEKGSIEIHFQACPDIQEKNQVMISGQVKDTGIGMNDYTLTKLFKPFSQGDNALYRQFGGTGLGLHITRQICEAMSGKIEVQSELGKGSIFSFNITLHALESSIPLTEGAKSTFSFPALNILIAEDNALIQKVFKAALGQLGCTVTIVPNGLRAFEAVKTEVYDVVLMDGEMPIMDGLEATRQIRQYLGPRTLPIIGVTAHALTSDRARFLASGMNGYLIKPVNLNDLKAEILRCLAIHKS